MKAIYPGCFDPITLKHLDIIERAAKLFDVLYVVINDGDSYFPLSVRIKLVRQSLKKFNNVEVIVSQELTVTIAQSLGASIIVRGLRDVSDYEKELQAASANKILCDNLETCFLITKPEYSYLSSSGVITIASLGGDIHSMVPNVIENLIKETVRVLE